MCKALGFPGNHMKQLSNTEQPYPHQHTLNANFVRSRDESNKLVEGSGSATASMKGVWYADNSYDTCLLPWRNYACK